MSNDSKEIGRVGQRRYGGIFYEEFLSELRGRKGAEVFTEMSNNDETIGAILFAIEMLVRQASWSVRARWKHGKGPRGRRVRQELHGRYAADMD